MPALHQEPITLTGEKAFLSFEKATMTLPWKMIFIRKAFRVFLFFSFYETLRTPGMHFLQFQCFLSYFFGGVMEMKYIKVGRGYSEVFNQKQDLTLYSCT